MECLPLYDWLIVSTHAVLHPLLPKHLRLSAKVGHMEPDFCRISEVCLFFFHSFNSLLSQFSYSIHVSSRKAMKLLQKQNRDNTKLNAWVVVDQLVSAGRSADCCQTCVCPSYSRKINWDCPFSLKEMHWLWNSCHYRINFKVTSG